jgi:hypothetical protein
MWLTECRTEYQEDPKNNFYAILLIVHVDGVKYVSELWPPTGLLFISELIYDMKNHGGMITALKNS